MKSDLLHGVYSLWIAHESTPNQPGAKILRHQHRDSLVDSEHIRVVPVDGGMERVHEAVSSPGMLSPF